MRLAGQNWSSLSISSRIPWVFLSLSDTSDSDSLSVWLAGWVLSASVSLFLTLSESVRFSLGLSLSPCVSLSVSFSLIILIHSLLSLSVCLSLSLSHSLALSPSRSQCLSLSPSLYGVSLSPPPLFSVTGALCLCPVSPYPTPICLILSDITLSLTLWSLSFLHHPFLLLSLEIFVCAGSCVSWLFWKMFYTTLLTVHSAF